MKKEKNKSELPWWRPAILMFYRLSGWIIGPIILALVVGRWLDEKYGTEPWLFLLSIGIAFAISIFGIVMDAIKELKRIEKDEKEDAQDKK